MPLETRELGRSGITAPRLGLGTATFGREIGEAAAFAIMDHAAARGITLFDTAEAYGGGEARAYRKAVLGMDDVREVSGEFHSSEKIIGRWLQASGGRDRIVLVSKVTSNFTPGHVREALAGSLERLGADYLDVYLFHQYDEATPLETALEAMEAVRTSGLVRAIGCSNFTGAQVREALEAARRLNLARMEVVEGICNLAAPEAETDLLPLCAEEQLGFLAYSPLGAGFLMGKYTPDRGALPEGSRFHVIPGHMDVYFSERNFAAVRQLHTDAARLGVPAARLAIQWVLEHEAVSTVLCGARTIAHLDNALAAAGQAELRQQAK
jgi:aryl-alcohol dehydrogenase-like predicted oxidoreductase